MHSTKHRSVSGWRRPIRVCLRCYTRAFGMVRTCGDADEIKEQHPPKKPSPLSTSPALCVAVDDATLDPALSRPEIPIVPRPFQTLINETKTYTASTPSVAYALYMREENHASKHVLQVSVRAARLEA